MNKTVIIVSTCDEYSDCWEPMIYCFEKFWSDCPFPIYFISNYKTIEHPFIKFITVGEHLGWGSNTKKALTQIECDHIIYFQEDYFFDTKVKTNNILEQINYCTTNKVDYLRLGPPFRIETSLIDQKYNEDTFSFRYALCLQPAIWNKEFINSLCIEGYTGWDFEFKIKDYIQENSIKSRNLVVHPNIFPDSGIELVPGTVVRKGLWTRKGVKFLMDNGFKHLIEMRKIEGIITTCLISIENRHLKKISWRILKFIQKNKINI